MKQERRATVVTLMSAVRLLTGCLALLSIVAGATGRAPDSAVLLASEQPAFVLNLHFTSSGSSGTTPGFSYTAP